MRAYIYIYMCARARALFLQPSIQVSLLCIYIYIYISSLERPATAHTWHVFGLFVMLLNFFDGAPCMHACMLGFTRVLFSVSTRQVCESYQFSHIYIYIV
jgi:hypothetical protein